MLLSHLQHFKISAGFEIMTSYDCQIANHTSNRHLRATPLQIEIEQTDYFLYLAILTFLNQNRIHGSFKVCKSLRFVLPQSDPRVRSLLYLYAGIQGTVLQFDCLFENNTKHKLSLENFLIIRITMMLYCH